MKCTIPLQPCGSSQLKEFGYDPETRTLAIRFHSKKGAGSLYTYQNVPPEIFEGLKAADAAEDQSVGKFFGANIKSNDAFPFTKIDEEE